MSRKALDGLMATYGRFIPITLKWFFENHPDVYEYIKERFCSIEHFEEAELMTQKMEEMNNTFFAYWRVGRFPLILEVKDFYTDGELRILSIQSGIDFKHFLEYSEALTSKF